MSHWKKLGPALLLASAWPAALVAQWFEPESAHVNLYFPQLADGGAPAQRWQTSFIFFNPSSSTTVSATLYLSADNGSPLKLNFGSGAVSEVSFTVPPQGTRQFRSTMASSTIVTGWAQAYATLPLEATVFYRYFVNDAPKVEISAPATLPSIQFMFPAPNKMLGIALANMYTDGPVSVHVDAYDAYGDQVGTAAVSVTTSGHTAANLYQLISGLADDFTGSVTIWADNPSDRFVAWAIGGDSAGILSTLPPGGMGSPISHWDRIWLVYSKVLDAAGSLSLGANLVSPQPTLDIASDSVIGAKANYDGVTIHYALSELINDSPSELAFLIGHQLGHVFESRLAGRGAPLKLLFSDSTGLEDDADRIGVLLALGAGYDPYAGAGALAKLSEINGRPGLNAPSAVDYEPAATPSVPPSWASRIDALYPFLQAICSDPSTSSSCNDYRGIMHPHFPPDKPFSAGRGSATRMSTRARAR